MSRRNHKTLLGITLALLAVLASGQPPADRPAAASDAGRSTPKPAGTIDRPSLEKKIESAEAFYAEGSFELALAIYRELDALDLDPEKARWVDFRLADTLWRSRAATGGSDPSLLEEARRRLEALVSGSDRAQEKDLVWAFAQESLGDFWWTRRQTRDWSRAWAHYQQALEWWAASADIDRARGRYLGIVFKLAGPPPAGRYYDYGYSANQLPLPVLENAVKIARRPDDRAFASFLLAMNLRFQTSGKRNHARVARAFEEAIAAGPDVRWFDDALYQFAEWMASSGKLVRSEGGGWSRQPDYPGALRLFRRLVSVFKKGETRYFDDAKRRIEQITGAWVSVAVSNVFLPGSEIEYRLDWRNVDEIDLALYRVDLGLDTRWDPGSGSGEWLQRMNLIGRRPFRTWTRAVENRGDHRPGSDNPHLDEDLPTGAYVLEARAGGKAVRDLVLVTSATLVLKEAPTRALLYLCDARDGSPRPGASVTLWARSRDARRGKWPWRSRTGRTDQDGLVSFDLPEHGVGELFATAADGEDQAFVSSAGAYRPPGPAAWRIFAFTDRPTYRPEETAHWKVVARRRDRSGYVTPSGAAIGYTITDPRGATVDEGVLKLNAFGSAWGELELSGEMPLGEYRVTFREKPSGSGIGAATLFRLEEFKLPEFQVQVRTPVEDGRRKTFLLGDVVEADIEASYYFGGPVTGGSVELLVYQRPLYVAWHPRREYDWYYDDRPARAMAAGPGQIVKRETITTDAEGKAHVQFETPAGGSQDFEYTIEARVTDASRREVTGIGTVRVGRQRYYVFPRAEHNLYRPGDEVRVAIKTVDANQQPIEATGRVKVTRDRWVEVWIDPQGREVSGEDLARWKRPGVVFPPPPPRPGGPAWRRSFAGYEHEEILARGVRTGQDGTAEFTFTARREGYYRVAWSSEEEDDVPVRADTTVWVADRRTADLQYHQGGVGIIVDKDTFRAGTTAQIMLTAPVSGATILFSVSGDDLLSYRLVRLTGTVKLLQLPIASEHVPNVFLEAVMVHDGELMIDRQEVIVPPVRHFLQVEVTSDREVYRPREKGIFTITTRDHEGHPVPAEVALGLVDASVFAIQEEYAADPRRFFFGAKRSLSVGTRSSFQHKRYVLLTETGQGTMRDDLRGDGGVVIRGVLGGVPGGVLAPAGEAGAKMRFAAAKSSQRRDLREKDRAGRYADRAEQYLDLLTLRQGVTGAEGESPNQGPAVEVRTDFRATAFWRPDVITGPGGRARVEVVFPDSLTAWRATARAATTSSRFGQATASSRTRKPLIVRLQAPRFFVAGDTATVSAVINNNTDAPLQVTPSLQADGLDLDDESRPVRVEAGGEARVDWRVKAREAGTARLKVAGIAGSLSDAMQRVYPVHEHGILKFLSRSGKLAASSGVGGEVRIRLDLPAERRPGATRLAVSVTPSLAVTMLDALPYLIDYPYGCTEQTMSRFLPAVIVTRTLQRLGLDPEQVASRAFGGIETAGAAATHPGGRKDLARLDAMVRKGLARLADFQHSDGGWGWWKEDSSDDFMTAYVVWGLALARRAGVSIEADVLRRGADFLAKRLVEREENPDMQAWMLHALASTGRHPRGSRFERVAFENLWSRRDRLSAYARALLALSAHGYANDDRAMVLVRNLANGVKRDDDPGSSILLRRGAGRATASPTAHWGSDGVWYRWSDGPVETTAFVLRALIAIDPGNDLVEPTAAWLLKNRRGAQWSNTRDTAITVLAMTDLLAASGELRSDVEYTLDVNGRRVAARHVRPADVLAAPSRFTVDPELIRDGENVIRIRRTGGSGPLYFAARAEFFSLEEPITSAGNEIFIRRDFLERVGRPTLLKGFVYHDEPLPDGGSVASGQRIVVVLTVEAKNDYEYLVFEDLKAAGFEAVALRSGGPVFARELRSSAFGRAPEQREPGDYTGRSRRVHQELRDRKVALFLDKLPEGVWEVRYELRAEVPGRFHALPALGHAMYVPEIRCNGDEFRVSVVDTEAGWQPR